MDMKALYAMCFVGDTEICSCRLANEKGSTRYKLEVNMIAFLHKQGFLEIELIDYLRRIKWKRLETPNQYLKAQKKYRLLTK